MPFAKLSDIQPKGIETHLGPPPTTMVAADSAWVRPAEMSYYSAQRKPQSRRTSPFEGLGAYEFEVLDTLPPSLVEYLADEAEDPAFVTDYLVPALRSRNPHKKIVDDIAEAAAAYETGMGDLGKSFFKKISKVVRKVHKSVATTVRKVHAKVTPKFMQKIEKKVHKVAKKTWHKYGNIIIGVAGAVLAPFTGGASLAAASVIIAAKNMYDQKKAADLAKKQAKAEAGQLQAQADAQAAQVAAQVDQFYNDNQAWFLQYDMTPAKWAQLTLDQKVEFINAGAEGRLPATAQPVTQGPDQVVAQTQQTVAAAQSAGVPPASVQPPVGMPGAGYATSGGGAPPPQEVEQQQAQAAAQAPGQFEAVVEGKSIGVYGSADEAFTAILAVTKPGDRFEIVANGESLGMAVRTAEGAVEVPPEAQAQMKQMTPEQSQAVVNKADAEQKAQGGGFPWWLIAAGGAAVLAAKG